MSVKRRQFNKFIGATALSSIPILGATAADSWALEANIAECCSCEIPCPCNFGRSTKSRCNGSRLIEIYKGHVDGNDLTGIRFIVTFEMGKWSRIYIDNTLNQESLNNFNLILPLAFAGFAKQAKSINATNINVARDKNIVKFSSPQSEVEMKPLKGMDAGLIKVDGLPYKSFYNYVQYESVKHIHNSPDVTWDHSGTNGFTSKMIVSG